MNETPWSARDTEHEAVPDAGAGAGAETEHEAVAVAVAVAVKVMESPWS